MDKQYPSLAYDRCTRRIMIVASVALVLTLIALAVVVLA